MSELEKRYFRLADYNRHRIIIECEKLLADQNIAILRSHFDKPFLMVCRAGWDTSEPLKSEIENQPARVIMGEWLHIEFIINGYFITIQIDENPFFPVLYSKIKIDESGNYTGKRYAYSTEDKPNRLNVAAINSADIFGIMTDEQIAQHARQFIADNIDFFRGSWESAAYTERHRHYYQGNRYYYETITDRTQCNIYYNESAFGAVTQYIEPEPTYQ